MRISETTTARSRSRLTMSTPAAPLAAVNTSKRSRKWRLSACSTRGSSSTQRILCLASLMKRSLANGFGVCNSKRRWRLEFDVRQWESNGKGRTHADRALDLEPPIVVIDNAAGDCEALPRPLAHSFGREEGIEDTGDDGAGNTAPRVGDCDDDMSRITRGRQRYGAFARSIARRGLDGMCGVHDQIQQHLVDLSPSTVNRRNLAKLSLDVGDVLVFVSRHNKGRANRVVEVR